MFQIIIAATVITLFLLLTSFWLRHVQRSRIRNRRFVGSDSNSSRRFHKPINRDPEEQYIEGVGYVIGDVSCSYNARSFYIRCAVNPDGLCQDCRHYHRKTE